MLSRQRLEIQIAALEKRKIRHKNQAALREELQRLLERLRVLAQCETDAAQLHRMRLVCHQKLRELQNKVCCHEKNLPLAPLDCADFLMQLCCACDLVLSGAGRRVLFRCETERLPLHLNRRALFTAVTNLLSNAFLHGAGEEVMVLLCENGSRAMIQVISQGESPLLRVQRARRVLGSGLCAAHCAAEACKGQLLLANQRGFTHALLAFPLAESGTQTPANADFTDLLLDSLSPVYIGLCNPVLLPAGYL